MRLARFLVVGSAAVLVWGTAAGDAARAPTYLERATIMDAFNIPERAFSSRCVRIVVSTADARYAMVTSPARPPRACVRAGQVGDGFAMFRRASRTSLRWRNIGEGSEPPCFVPARVRRDLFGSSRC